MKNTTRTPEHARRRAAYEAGLPEDMRARIEAGEVYVDQDEETGLCSLYYTADRAPSFGSPGGGPGYARMRRNLGPAGYDALCEDSLRRKEEALADAAAARRTAEPPRDRETYKGYPAPRGRRGRRN